MERQQSIGSAPAEAELTSANLNTPEKVLFKTLSAPVSVQWEVTPWCNQDCWHCYNHWRKDRSNKFFIPDQEITERVASELIQNKVFNVTITGGEDLAVIENIYPQLEKMAENGIALSVNSNLTLLTKERARMLKGVGVRSILCSLMSSDEKLHDFLAGTEGSFRRTVNGIRLALDEGFWVGVNMVVSQKNLDSVFDTAAFVKSLGVNSFSATKASKPLNAGDFSDFALSRAQFVQMFDHLLKVKRDLGLNIDSLEFYPTCGLPEGKIREAFGGRICNAGKTACTIGSFGEIRPCSHSNQIYGSLKSTGGLHEAWVNLQPWRTTQFIPAECEQCKLINICKGGCRTEALADKGDLKASDPYCDYGAKPAGPKKIEFPQVEGEGVFTFHCGIKHRPESFGGILFVTPVRWLPVSGDLYSFYLEKQAEDFTLSDLAQSLGSDKKEILKTARFLKYRTIIKERG